MMRPFLLLSTLFALSRAFTSSRAFLVRPTTAYYGMAQPEIQIKTKTTVETKQKQKVVNEKKSKTGEPVSRRDEDFQDAPMYKVSLKSRF